MNPAFFTPKNNLSPFPETSLTGWVASYGAKSSVSWGKALLFTERSVA